ncbi:PREDICTED: uncharacterized protein LOC105953863 [Erythranthe guttata]|uniref:uncharacterized protein LOC105953863 n=1 Tax=Erythranthe guttata TaxID=4155 RepID=UPI00064DAAE7|nr:PREDICTED: uncharacterized protein LOC105953863 [Erythranthe guttata]|eukprot:XP_012832997.1 PREDICTED: uncharacterized protein LOC105953863 [Erythranthe guttata]
MSSQSPLDWQVRKRIALGTASGLACLHNECERKIIHRDIKAANIFLNEDFDAIIGNFGISIVTDHVITDVPIQHVCGTIGHIAPEYLAKSICSEKSDVYGYGIFLLELITRQTSFDLDRLAHEEDMMLVDWVRAYIKVAKCKKGQSSGGEMLSTPVYMSQPSGFIDEQFPNHVYKLNKPIYGLKQAPRAWFSELQRWNHSPSIETFVKKFGSQFSIKDLALDRANVVGTKAVKTPLSTGNTLSISDSAHLGDAKEYCKIVGNLQYLMLIRPDIAYAVYKLAQFANHPTTNHWTAVKRVLRYLGGSFEHGLFLSDNSPLTLHAYSDSDWVGNKDDHTSTSAFVVLLGRNPIA